MAYTWTTLDPPFHARYRMEWRLKTAHLQESEPMNTLTPSALKVAAGMIQEGGILLQTVAQPFDLPAETDRARHAVRELDAAISRVKKLHGFGKDMGIAAPDRHRPRRRRHRPARRRTHPDRAAQPHNRGVLGRDRPAVRRMAAVLRRTGPCPRPLHGVIAYTDTDGTPRFTRFDHGLARLVLHEVDRLDGKLYRSRMKPGTQPIPAEEYRGTGLTQVGAVGEHQGNEAHGLPKAEQGAHR
ncbi:peptide deformylase [Streptomyces sp. NPDC015350]|uniref:peptide deformylase n=1 Tax=Streptomyces sp. NPDC015350 TaxID=3364955 RepID=UPI0037004389